METGKLELNKNEAQVLLECVDANLKARWLSFAESAVHLNKLLQSAFPIEEKVEDKPAEKTKK